MKLAAVVVVAVLGCGGAPVARAPNAPAPGAVVKYPEALAMMERFLAAPFADPADTERVKTFVAHNHDVLVIIDAAAAPYVDEDLDPEARSLLLSGLAAGSAASQLRAGTRGDDPFAGITAELQIYRALRGAADAKLKDHKVISPSMDVLVTLEASGQLRGYVDRLVVRRAEAAQATAAGTATEAAFLPTPTAASADPAGVSDSDARPQLVAAQQRLMAGHPDDALAMIEQVIAGFEQQYANDPHRIYCGHDHAETLMYLLTAANDHREAVALDSTWADAWYFKSYALTELHRDVDARLALEQALELSPNYARYLSELGYQYTLSKQWKLSLETFKRAEASSHLVEDPAEQLAQRTRSLRGQGYALVELGDLDGAEALYRQSLAISPDDTKATQELEYVQGLRARRK